MGELFNVVWFHCNEQDLDSFCSPQLRGISEESEGGRNKREMKIGFVVWLFMLLREENLEQAI